MNGKCFQGGDISDDSGSLKPVDLNGLIGHVWVFLLYLFGHNNNGDAFILKIAKGGTRLFIIDKHYKTPVARALWIFFLLISVSRISCILSVLLR